MTTALSSFIQTQVDEEGKLCGACPEKNKQTNATSSFVDGAFGKQTLHQQFVIITQTNRKI